MKNVFFAVLVMVVALVSTGCAGGVKGFLTKPSQMWPPNTMVTAGASGRPEAPLVKSKSVSVSGPGFGYSRTEQVGGSVVPMVGYDTNGTIVHSYGVYKYSYTNTTVYRHNTDRPPTTYTAPATYPGPVYGPQGPKGTTVYPR